jgi:hypothetical protein
VDLAKCVALVALTVGLLAVAAVGRVASASGRKKPIRLDITAE